MPLRAPGWIPTPGNRRMARSLAELDAAVAAILAQRHTQGPSDPPDLLDMLLASPLDRLAVRDEIVTFGVPEEIVVDESGIVGGGIHLSPAEVNELVASRGDDVVFFDGRNEYEAAIGKFKNAVVPPIETTPEFVKVLESGAYDHLKDKPIVTYCTGGIRCEVLSLIMKNRGFKEVYQIDGGIVRYAEKFKDTGLWEGSLYVFDRRFKLDYSKDTKVLSTCHMCDSPTSEYHNCSNLTCRRRTLVCPTCADQTDEVFCHDCLL
jgi:UPF0176 protein